MIPIPRREHRILLAIHGWSGVVLGLLLLVIVATGTVAVFGDKIGAWSSGSVETRSPLTRPIDAVVRRLLAEVPADLRQRVDLGTSAANHLAITMHGSPGPEERGVVYDVGSDGRVLHRFEGLTRDIEDADPAGALSSFLIHVHVRLYVPEPWGYGLTGIAGLAMLAAAVSGFVIHRHLVTDLFTIRKAAAPVLKRRDRHGVAAAWALPFAFLLAFTGCFFSFAASFGFPAVAWVSFGGDQQKLIATLVGTPDAGDATPAEGADLDGIIADATIRAGTGPDFLAIDRPGRADERVTVSHEVRNGELNRPTLVYDGRDGSFVAEKPGVGRVPSTGGLLYGLMGPLHFGDFAGLLSKAVWAALGFATSFVIVSGLRLWLARRDLSDPAWALLDRLTSIAALGLPFAMATAAAGYFLALPSGTTVHWTAAGFIAGLVLALAAALAFGRPVLDDLLGSAAGLVLLALPVLRLAAGGPSWMTALGHAASIVIMGDGAVVLIGAAFLWAPLRRWRPSRVVEARLALLRGPAE